jgi:hypothetical protein
MEKPIEECGPRKHKLRGHLLTIQRKLELHGYWLFGKPFEKVI